MQPAERLATFTQSLHDATGQLEMVADLGSHPDLGAPQARLLTELASDLAELRQRTEAPEVRVLVLGPLKAGKSTLMNTLVRRPNASQVSVLPAFPCFVEIRDLERDASGAALGAERSLRFDRAGTVVEELSLDACQDRLEELLRAYLRADSAATKARLADSCVRIEQRIDLGRSPEGLDLVLVDSPGLFFDTNVDDEILRATQSSTDPALPEPASYSAVSRQLYGLADVAIFVIRPEQLFFEVVAQWLARFVERPKMHVFLVVNASAHARNLDGARLEPIDQVDARQELCDYFLHHVAGARLTGELVLGHKLSLEVADLLDVAAEELTGQSAGSGSVGHSRDVVERIRGYLATEDLVGVKIANLTDRFRSQVRATQDVVGHLTATTRGRHEAAATRLEVTRQTIAHLAAELVVMGRQLVGVDADATVADTRLQQLARWAQGEERPESHGDVELSGYLELFTPSQSAGDPLGVDHLDDRRLRALMAKILRDWASAEYGERHLRNLAKLAWTHQPAAGAEPLVDQYHAALRDRCRRVLGACRARHHGDKVRVGLAGALAGVTAENIELYLANPLPPERDLPSLRPTLRRFGVFSVNWDRFWGRDRDRPINGRWLDRLLDAEDEVVAGMLHDPWELADSLAPYRLEYDAREATGVAVGATWQAQLKGNLAGLAEQRRALLNRQNDLGEALELAREAEQNETATIDQLTAELAELDRRAKVLAELDQRIQTA